MKTKQLDLLSDETVIKQTKFGTVTTKRVIYQHGMKFFSSGSRQDVPIQHITSVGHELKRRFFIGLLLIIFGLPLIVIIVGIFMIIKGIFFMIGYPIVTINTSGQDKSVMVGKPSTKKEADNFVKSLRSVIFGKQTVELNKE